MPQRRAAQKTLRADKKRRERNLVIRAKLKQTTKQFLRAVEAKDIKDAKKKLDIVYKALDKAAFEKYIHKNKAGRKKSRLSKKLRSLTAS
jgi:small subunit ribosomal protein S20